MKTFPVNANVNARSKLLPRHRRTFAGNCRAAFVFAVYAALPFFAPAAASGQEVDAAGKTELTLEASVQYALAHNPQLAALRQQHGIAEGGVVVAKTYPFNPVYQGTFLNAQAAQPGAVTNPVSNAHQLTIEVQLFNQQHYREQAAYAALSRTDWEIATQELTYVANAIRAFDGYLYRQQKLAVTEEFLRLNEKSVEEVRQLVERGTLKPGDLILSRAEVNDVQAQVALNRTALVTAKRDFYRALGISSGEVEPVGTLDRAAPTGTAERWLTAATELRPDRRARLAAVNESEADIEFQRANRFGNPQIGPVYEQNESGTTFVGAKIQFPLPLFNRLQGEIVQAESRRSQASLSVRQADVEIEQDVTLSAARLREAVRLVESYRTEILPTLEKSLRDMEELFRDGQAGVDVLRVLDVRRKLLRAQDGNLDALLTYTQALADFAQAVGDPALATGFYREAPPLAAPIQKRGL